MTYQGFYGPIQIRGHHIESWKRFLSLGGSEKDLIGSYGNDAIETDFHGYGEGFVTNFSRIFTYLTKNPESHVIFTDSFDALCEECKKKSGCMSQPEFDPHYVKALGMEMGKEYTSQEILHGILRIVGGKEINFYVFGDKKQHKKIKSVIKSLRK